MAPSIEVSRYQGVVAGLGELAENPHTVSIAVQAVTIGYFLDELDR